MLLTKTVAQADPPPPFGLRTDKAGKIRAPARHSFSESGRPSEEADFLAGKINSVFL